MARRKKPFVAQLTWFLSCHTTFEFPWFHRTHCTLSCGNVTAVILKKSAQARWTLLLMHYTCICNEDTNNSRSSVVCNYNRRSVARKTKTTSVKRSSLVYVVLASNVAVPDYVEHIAGPIMPNVVGDFFCGDFHQQEENGKCHTQV